MSSLLRWGPEHGQFMPKFKLVISMSLSIIQRLLPDYTAVFHRPDHHCINTAQLWFHTENTMKGDTDDGRASLYLRLQHWKSDSGGSWCVGLFILSSARQLVLEHLFQSIELLIAGEAHVHWRTLHRCEGIRNQKHFIRDAAFRSDLDKEVIQFTKLNMLWIAK